MAKEGGNSSGRRLVSEALHDDQARNGGPPAMEKLAPSPDMRLMTETELADAIARQEATRPKWASDHLGPNSSANEGRNFRKPSGSDRNR